MLARDDGTFKNVVLIDKRNIHNNRLQVINQYEVGVDAARARATRYDVTILVNGLPLVHVELKRRGVAIREAFNQINRYQRDSFWSGSGLFEYVQLFVISNGTHTKYYSNTTRDSARRRAGRARSAGGRRRTASSSRAGGRTPRNRPIADLTGFTKTFFAKHTLLSILTRYCVFDADRKLLVMRPYQIAATERILQRIETSTNHRQLGTIAAGGYVWHTTGSGKTLTSFKAAQLASRLPDVDKVVFVVDRKDLDYQTMREYERFEKGAANSNVSTSVLKRQLEDPDARIIITTIQKLARFVDQNKGHAIYDGHVVLIFDECHRSQFGDMHVAIEKAFKRYHLFGFTGTPIFADERRQLAATPGSARPSRRSATGCTRTRSSTRSTTGTCCRSGIDYVNTIKLPAELADKQVSAIDTERALLAPERIGQVVALHPRALRPEDQAQLRLHAGGQAARRLQLAARHRLDRRREALLRRVREAAGRAAGGRSGSRSGSSTATPRTRTTRRLPRRGGVRDRRPGRELARLPRGGDLGLQRDVRHELRHLVGQVPELLQGPLAAAPEPRDRPRRSSSTCS